MTLWHWVSFFYLSVTHTDIISGKGDETREYNHTPTSKLHAAVSVAKQVINPFSISHLCDLGWLDNTVFLFIFYFLVKHTYILTHTSGKGDETRQYTHTPTTKLHVAHSVALQVINPFSISNLIDMGWLYDTEYIFFIYLLRTHTHYIREGRWDKGMPCMPTPKLHAAISVSEPLINPFSISDITDVGRLDNTKGLFFLFFFVKQTQKKIILGKGDETR